MILIYCWLNITISKINKNKFNFRFVFLLIPCINSEKQFVKLSKSQYSKEFERRVLKVVSRSLFCTWKNQKKSCWGCKSSSVIKWRKQNKKQRFNIKPLTSR